MITKKRKIYIFGNPLLDFDNLPIKIKPQLEKSFPDIDFIIQDPNENLKPENGELFIIDTVMGIDKVTVIDDLNKLAQDSLYSLHDLDLGFNLKLLKKIDKLKKITIFGVPADISPKEALSQLTNEIHLI